MNRLMLLVVLIAYHIPIYAQAPDTLWTRTFGDPDADEVGNSVQQTQDGGYIIIGTAANSENSVILIKTNGQGDEEWTKKLFNIGSTNGNSGQQTADGGYIITGISFFGGDNVWLIKVDSNGLEEWNKTFGGSGFDEGKSVQQTSDGGYIITGFTSSFGAGESDVWLIKTDANGTEVWNKTFGTSESEEGSSVQQTSDGGYIISGTGFGVGDRAGLLIKTDMNGNEEWSKRFEESDMFFLSVQQASDGGYIVGGIGKLEPLLLKTDENGIEEWNTRFSEFGQGSINSVRRISDSGYILTGLRTSTAGGLLFIKTNALGKEEWKTLYGLTGSAAGNSVQQTSDGGHIITGRFGNDIWLIRLAAEAVGVEEEIGFLPEKYSLSQNYPNPFNPVTTIKYSLPQSGDVTLLIYNLIGEEVARLVNGHQSAGEYNAEWNASKVSSGIYFYRLKAGDFVRTRKMVLLK